MTSFLFWNVMKNDLRSLLAQAVIEREVDILLIAEAKTSDDADTLTTLKSDTGFDFVGLSLPSDKVRIYSRIPSTRWTRRQTDALSARMAIWSVDIGKPPGILLATTHFISKNNSSTDDQALLAVELAKEIIRVEESVGYERTVLVGDVNMNPFEHGIIGANALHAVMSKAIAVKLRRTVQETEYPFFYNPMWGLFGDRTTGPPGTFYRRSPAVGELFWHMLDQVLVRPSLMDSLHDLVILDNIGTTSLVTHPGALPRHNEYSDHLPLAFRLKLD